jgi:3-oxoacyl-[acyl-carrier protein] reductase
MMYNPFDLSGRGAFVTGAGSGIGRATAIRLAGAGAVVTCADIDAEAAARTATGITSEGGSASSVSVDVSDKASVHEAVSAVPNLMILCNIAGVISNARVEDLTTPDLDRILSVNLKGTLFCAQAAIPLMREQGRGSIINVASAAIDGGAAKLAAYAMSKAAVAQLSKTMATELAPDRIRVNAIAPGLIETNMISRHFTDEQGDVDAARREAYLDPIRQKTPLGIVGEPDDIAMTMWYLAADASRFMTGQILRPNGGVAMPW